VCLQQIPASVRPAAEMLDCKLGFTRPIEHNSRSREPGRPVSRRFLAPPAGIEPASSKRVQCGEPDSRAALCALIGSFAIAPV
jgi:hypothetical protein